MIKELTVIGCGIEYMSIKLRFRYMNACRNIYAEDKRWFNADVENHAYPDETQEHLTHTWETNYEKFQGIESKSPEMQATINSALAIIKEWN